MTITIVSWVGIAFAVIMLIIYFALRRYIKKKTIEYDGFWGIVTKKNIDSFTEESIEENDQNM